MFKGEQVYLRTIEPWDADRILKWENDPENWRVSNTLVPFSKHMIEQYVNSSQDIFSFRQLRLMIALNENQDTIGAVDLFDFEPRHQRAGVGILVEKEYRNKGIGKEALRLLEEYVLNVLGVRNLYCNILEDNPGSIKLFEDSGYKRVGVKKNWFSDNGKWLDEFMYQKELVK